MQVISGRAGIVFNRFAFLFLLAALFAGFAVSACAVPSPYTTGTWRYKMTVTVSTPEGDKVGSAVREVSVKNALLPGHSSGYPEVKGEAVVVDLGKRGALFAIMRGVRSGRDYGHQVVFDAFPSPTNQRLEYYSHLKAGPVELPPDDWPVFVHFKDPKDPSTVEPVLETGWDSPRMGRFILKADHTEEIYGKGVKIKSVSIEMTKEPITWNGDKYFPKYDDKFHFVQITDLKRGR